MRCIKEGLCGGIFCLKIGNYILEVQIFKLDTLKYSKNTFLTEQVWTLADVNDENYETVMISENTNAVEVPKNNWIFSSGSLAQPVYNHSIKIDGKNTKGFAY